MADDNVNTGVDETQPESVDTVAEEAPKEEQIDLGKFKTVAELKKAYDNLEKMALTDHQKMKQLEKVVASMLETPVPKGQVDREAEREQFFKRLAEDPEGTLGEVIRRYVEPIQQETRSALYYNELTRLDSKYGDVKEVYPVMEEVIKSMGINPSPGNLERIYKLAKQEIAEASGEVAKANKQVLKQEIAKEKTGAVVETGTAASSGEKTMTPEQKLDLEIEEAIKLAREGKVDRSKVARLLIERNKIPFANP